MCLHPVAGTLRMYKDAQKGQSEDFSRPFESGNGWQEKPVGTILVFLPGWGDIDTLQKRLATNFDAKRFKILPLHSQVGPSRYHLNHRCHRTHMT